MGIQEDIKAAGQSAANQLGSNVFNILTGAVKDAASNAGIVIGEAPQQVAPVPVFQSQAPANQEMFSMQNMVKIGIVLAVVVGAVLYFKKSKTGRV